MGIVSILLLIALIVLYIFIKRDDRRNWETVYEASGGSKVDSVQRRYAYLKRNRIHCHLKTLSPRVGQIQSKAVNPSMSMITRINVRKSDAARARQLLNEFQKS